MNIFEIVLGGSPSDEDVMAATATTFGLADEDISIVHHLEELLDVSPILVVQRLENGGGEFSSRLTIYDRRDDADSSDLDISRSISVLLSTAVLFPGRGPDPYRMNYIGADGAVLTAFLDASRLDEDNEYHIIALTGSSLE